MHFYLHTKLVASSAQKRENGNCVVLSQKVEHQIPYEVPNTGHVCNYCDKGGASRMAYFPKSSSLFRDKLAISVLH